MSFYMQAGNPEYKKNFDKSDVTLSDAVETVFPMDTEAVIMMWNHIAIPLSYKYDIGYMMDDIISLLCKIESEEECSFKISWLPDTFRCDWMIHKKKDSLTIQAVWESITGKLELLLNQCNTIELKADDFISEWKMVLEKIIQGLEHSGYTGEKLRGMVRLVDRYDSIKTYGKLYCANRIQVTYRTALKAIIERLLNVSLTRNKLWDEMLYSFDGEVICDAGDLLISDAYFTLMHFANGEEHIVRQEWEYFLECLNGIRTYSMEEKLKITAPYIQMETIR